MLVDAGTAEICALIKATCSLKREGLELACPTTKVIAKIFPNAIEEGGRNILRVEVYPINDIKTSKN